MKKGRMKKSRQYPPQNKGLKHGKMTTAGLKYWLFPHHHIYYYQQQRLWTSTANSNNSISPATSKLIPLPTTIWKVCSGCLGSQPIYSMNHYGKWLHKTSRYRIPTTTIQQIYDDNSLPFYSFSLQPVMKAWLDILHSFFNVLSPEWIPFFIFNTMLALKPL